MDLRDDLECTVQCRMSFFVFASSALIELLPLVLTVSPVARAPWTLGSCFASCLALDTRSPTRTHICNRLRRTPSPRLLCLNWFGILEGAVDIFRPPPASASDSFQRPTINLKECFSVKGHNHERTHTSVCFPSRSRVPLLLPCPPNYPTHMAPVWVFWTQKHCDVTFRNTTSVMWKPPVLRPLPNTFHCPPSSPLFPPSVSPPLALFSPARRAFHATSTDASDPGVVLHYRSCSGSQVCRVIHVGIKELHLHPTEQFSFCGFTQCRCCSLVPVTQLEFGGRKSQFGPN